MALGWDVTRMERLGSWKMSKWDIVAAAFGLLLIVGSVRNWNWLCDPTGAPYAYLFGRGVDYCQPVEFGVGIGWFGR